jgi:phosphoribosylanthranilate isomerase
MTKQRIRVKICGITRAIDAQKVALAGADALGLVFYLGSPRVVSLHQAQSIVAALPPFVTTVGLFVNADAQEVKHVLSQIPLDVLQFHGEESPQYCQSFARPYIKAIRMRPDTDVKHIAKIYAKAQALLLDNYIRGIKGGTGSQFDWQWFPHDVHKPLILAGGLQPDNVAKAIKITQPYAVDVSGGVEAAKGIKDSDKILEFIQQVNQGGA